MRVPLLAVLACCTLLASSAARGDEVADPTFNAHELENIWRFCSVSGRASAAKVACIRAQANRMLEGKKVERENRRMEALTRKELAAPQPDADK